MLVPVDRPGRRAAHVVMSSHRPCPSTPRIAAVSLGPACRRKPFVPCPGSEPCNRRCWRAAADLYPFQVGRIGFTRPRPPVASGRAPGQGHAVCRAASTAPSRARPTGMSIARPTLPRAARPLGRAAGRCPGRGTCSRPLLCLVVAAPLLALLGFVGQPTAGPVGAPRQHRAARVSAQQRAALPGRRRWGRWRSAPAPAGW